jgi:hypothetical protein
MPPGYGTMLVATVISMRHGMLVPIVGDTMTAEHIPR